MEEVGFDNPGAALATRPLIDIPAAEATARGKHLRVGFDPEGPAFQRLRMSGACPEVVQLSVLGSKPDSIDANAFLKSPRREDSHFVCECEFINYRRKKKVQTLVLSMDENGGRRLAELLCG